MMFCEDGLSSAAGHPLATGHLLIDTQFIEQVADLMHDTAFIMKKRPRALCGREPVARRAARYRREGADDRQAAERGVPGRFWAHPDRVGRAGFAQWEAAHWGEMFWRKPHVPVWGLTSKIPVRDAKGRCPVSSASGAFVYEAVSPSSLARSAGMSAARFARVIKRIHGIWPCSTFEALGVGEFGSGEDQAGLDGALEIGGDEVGLGEVGIGEV